MVVDCGVPLLSWLIDEAGKFCNKIIATSPRLTALGMEKRSKDKWCECEGGKATDCEP